MDESPNPSVIFELGEIETELQQLQNEMGLKPDSPEAPPEEPAIELRQR